MKIYFIFFFICFTFINEITAQDKNFKIPDSLKQKSFSELKSLFYTSESKSIKESIYSNTYLKKAINSKDSIEIAKGYLFLTSTAKNDIEKEEFIDKSILFSEGKSDFLVPCTAYSIKASLSKQKKQFKLALDYYLLTHKSADRGKNIDLKYITKYNIGLLKNEIGHHDETIDYMNDCIEYFGEENRYSVYMSSLCMLSNSYTYKKEFDIASDINLKGIKQALTNKDEEHYKYFIFYEGINRFYRGEYNSGIDSIKKVLPYLKKSKNNFKIAMAYYYLGQCYSKIDNEQKSKINLKKVDSMFLKDNYLPIYSRGAYELLWNYEEENKLYYINQLLKLDSILNSNYKDISSTLYKEYELLELLTEKEKLKKGLFEERKIFNKYILLLIIIVLIITLALFFSFYKKKKYQRKYLKLIRKIDDSKYQEQRSENLTEKKIEPIEEINEEIIKNTLENLANFELSKGFLNNGLTLNSLAKKVKTNSRYLSKIINIYKRKSYSNYMNDLRINYIVNELNSNEKFRKYTIDAIAKEAGFNNRRSFSHVFLKKTGISAAFFIDKLNDDDN